MIIQWKEKIGRKKNKPCSFLLCTVQLLYIDRASNKRRHDHGNVFYYCTVYCALYSSLQTFKHELFEPSPLTTADSLYNFAQHSLIVPCMQSCEAFRICSSKNRIRIFRRRIRMSMLKFKTCLSNLTVNVFLLLLLFTFVCQIQFKHLKNNINNCVQ